MTTRICKCRGLKRFLSFCSLALSFLPHTSSTTPNFLTQAWLQFRQSSVSVIILCPSFSHLKVTVYLWNFRIVCKGALYLLKVQFTYYVSQISRPPLPPSSSIITSFGSSPLPLCHPLTKDKGQRTFVRICPTPLY